MAVRDLRDGNGVHVSLIRRIAVVLFVNDSETHAVDGIEYCPIALYLCLRTQSYVEGQSSLES